MTAVPGKQDHLHQRRRIAGTRGHPLEIGAGHPSDPDVELKSQDRTAGDGPHPYRLGRRLRPGTERGHLSSDSVTTGALLLSDSSVIALSPLRHA